MASLNMIQHGRYNRALQKLLSLKGQAQITDIGSEVIASLPLFWGAEMRYLESWDRFVIGESRAAGAGNVGSFQLRNPVGSNIVAIVELLEVAVSTAATVTLSGAHGQSTDLATVYPGIIYCWDPRGRNSSTCIASHNEAVSQANLAVTLRQPVMAANTLVQLVTTDIQEFPLLPGDAIRLTQQTAAQTNTWGIMWRERFLEESERS